VIDGKAIAAALRARVMRQSAVSPIAPASFPASQWCRWAIIPRARCREGEQRLVIQRTATGPTPVTISRSGRCLWRASRWRLACPSPHYAPPDRRHQRCAASLPCSPAFQFGPFDIVSGMSPKRSSAASAAIRLSRAVGFTRRNITERLSQALEATVRRIPRAWELDDADTPVPLFPRSW
jgi:hypothetical protein